jgi:carboxyl-terminal processing protease
MNTFKKTFLYLFLVILIVGSINLANSWAKDRYDDLQLFAKVLNLVQQYYVENVDTKKLIYGGIKGMLRELDPHTNFLPPDVYKEFESETSGEFGGLGIEITVQKGVLTVISPIEDTPAYIAGIKAGDKIVSINGESTKGFNLVDASQKMRGSTGAKVVLGIFREGFDKPKDFTIVRGTVKIKSVKYTDLDDGYAYVRITSFIEHSGNDLRKELEAHIKRNKNMKGMVLDLRKNPGGLLDQAVSVSDLLLDKGIIVSTMDRNKKEKQIIYAKKENTLPPFPLVVLIDEYSASASEIVAGALQDNKRALIMGQRSFGKGSVQSVVRLGDGSGLKLTVARYYTPSGRSIQAEGILPDVVVDNISADLLEKSMIQADIRREQDIKGHLEADDGFDGINGQDKSAKKDAKDNDGPTFMQLWWGGSEKDSVESNAKSKLLKEDFQVLQAYNYLRAWKVMKAFETPDEQASADKKVQ